MKKVCKVLIVEDDIGVKEMLREVVHGEGYCFTLAESGAEMRKALAGDPSIDIVIIDIRLPGDADGFVLAEEAAVRGLPVILTSGDHTHAAAMEKSCHRHILKPFRIANFLELIDDTLAAARANCRRKHDAAVGQAD